MAELYGDLALSKKISELVKERMNEATAELQQLQQIEKEKHEA